MDALRQLAQLLDRGRELVDGAARSASSRLDEPALRAAQLEQERDQALLRAVVEVALEPPPRVVGGGDDARSRSRTSASCRLRSVMSVPLIR